VWYAFHGEGRVNDVFVGAGVNQTAGGPHEVPEVGAGGADAPGVEVAECLVIWVSMVNLAVMFCSSW
jgi:hypothetical protein